MASDAVNTDDCWLWAGYKDATAGYGSLSAGHGKSPLSAHRLVYEALVGPIPEGLVIDHLCRVPSCVNPGHLEPVTQEVNILRGEGISAMNAKKTLCPYGHPLDQPFKSGKNVWRRCSVCHASAERKRREEKGRIET